MNPADKVKLKQIYLEETGQSIPDTDIAEFLLSMACSIGESVYQSAVESAWVDEPDCPAIQDYVEWLENRAIR